MFLCPMNGCAIILETCFFALLVSVIHQCQKVLLKYLNVFLSIYTTFQIGKGTSQAT